MNKSVSRSERLDARRKLLASGERTNMNAHRHALQRSSFRRRGMADDAPRYLASSNGLVFVLILICAAILAACTHSSVPSLTSEERLAAQNELARWESGQIVVYTSADEKKLRARLYPPAATLRAMIVALHGLETYGRWFAPLAAELNKKGIGVFAMDRRGSGLNKGVGAAGQNGPVDDYHLWLSDISTAAEQASRFGAPVYVMGNSWGGILSWRGLKAVTLRRNHAAPFF
jgi:predicted alpha/beta-fold hydrolase